MIFCAAHDEFSDRHSKLPQANRQPRGQGCCIDFIVEADLVHGRFNRVDLEEFSLRETLQRVGLDNEADLLSVALSKETAEVLPVVAHVLERLFEAT